MSLVGEAQNQPNLIKTIPELKNPNYAKAAIPDSKSGQISQPRRLWLVRHGQTTWNIEGRLQGQTANSELTELGHQQAQMAAAQLQSFPARYLFVSDSLRTQQTAAPIAAVLGLEPILEPLLREQYFGEMEGKLRTELHACATPPGWHINDVRWGDGESVADVFARFEKFVAKLRQLPPGDVVGISHGGLIRVAQCWADGNGPHDVVWKECPNGSITKLVVP